MSYTLLDTPVNFSPVGAPSIFTVQSSNFGESNFRYVAQLYDESNNFLGELKAVPQPSTGWGKFDISRIIGSTLDTQFDPSENQFSNVSAKGLFRVEFGEEYVDGSFVRSTEITSHSGTYFNGTPYWNEFLSLREDNKRYLRPTVSDGLPLTARRYIQTSRGTKQWLYFVSTSFTQNAKIQIEDLDINTTVIVNLQPSLQTNLAGTAVAFRVDADYLEGITLLTDLERWRVRTLNDSNNPTSEWTYYEHLPCEKWDLYSLYYINRWGGVDSFSFHGRSSIEVQTRRESYSNNLTPIKPSGEIDYSNTRHNVIDYSVTQEDIIKLSSGWIDYSNQVSVVDLQASQRVWMEDKDGIIVPVNINSESIEINQSNNRVLSVSLEVKYTQPIKRS